MIDLHCSRMNTALILGPCLILLGLMETCSGEALQRYGRMASRREDSKTFWQAVTIHYLGGFAAIGYYLYERFLTH